MLSIYHLKTKWLEAYRFLNGPKDLERAKALEWVLLQDMNPEG
jgi:hypothetical protein